jgi:integrase
MMHLSASKIDRNRLIMASFTPRKDQDGHLIGYQVHIRKKGFPTQTSTFRTKSEAQKWASVIESEMVRGVFVSRAEAEKTTVAEALDRYATEVSVQKKGCDRELSVIKQMKTSSLGKMTMAGIQGKDVAKYRDTALADGLSPITIKRRLSVLSHLFTIATKEWGMGGLINPVPLVSIPRKNNARDRRLTDYEEECLIKESEAYGSHLPNIIQFALETAMRRSEIASMDWKHVYLQKMTLHIPDSKNGQSRTVPLSPKAIQILSSLPRQISGSVWGIRADSITQAFERTRKRAGIEDLRFHDLRHEATSRFFEQGFNIMEVASITGHKTLQMLKRYTHLKAEDLAKRMR